MDLGPVLAPLEVIGPNLSSRIKNGNDLTGMWVAAFPLTCLEIVAHSAGKPQIRFVVADTRGRRDDMLNLQLPQDEVLRTQAVAASVSGSGPDAVPNIL